MNIPKGPGANPTVTFSSTDKVIGRLLEFFHRRKPWHRRLWSIGTVLSLQEVREYGQLCLEGVHPTTDGLRYVVSSARREIQRDPGVAQLATELDGVLARLDVQSAGKVDKNALAELSHLADRSGASYFEGWFRATGTTPVEFTARAVASHLLDHGFSGDHLYRWLSAKRSSIANLTDVARLADEMMREMPLQGYEIFVPCAKAGNDRSGTSTGTRWMDGRTAANWLTVNAPGGETRRHNGGFVYSVEARDPWAAVDVALELFNRTAARVRVAQAANDELRPDGWVRVAGLDRSDFEARSPRRQVEIGSLKRLGVLYNVDRVNRSPIDDALELASYMEGTGTGAAVTGGWAAVEGLLIRPSEGSHYLAADRLAVLIACSTPRAELTPLSYGHQNNASDDLAVKLKAAGSNRERVQLVEERLRQTQKLEVQTPEDAAALDRIVAMINDPAGELRRIATYVTESLRRLYNQRNLVMHAGTFKSVALEATLRTSLSLVGAGLDRIVHAHFSPGRQLSPLELVARAEIELRLLGSAGARPLADLLE